MEIDGGLPSHIAVALARLEPALPVEMTDTGGPVRGRMGRPLSGAGLDYRGPVRAPTGAVIGRCPPARIDGRGSLGRNGHRSTCFGRGSSLRSRGV